MATRGALSRRDCGICATGLRLVIPENRRLPSARRSRVPPVLGLGRRSDAGAEDQASTLTLATDQNRALGDAGV